MNMVDVSVFYDELASRISGAPMGTIRNELEATLREFYVFSAAYVAFTVPQDIVANKVNYDVSVQPTGNVLVTFSVKVDDRITAFRGTTGAPGVIELRNKPSTGIDNGLIAAVALKPKQCGTIPEETVTYDFDTILDGVTGRMYMMPDRPWSNSPQAQYYLKRFRQGMSRARVRVRSQYTTADASWKFPAW